MIIQHLLLICQDLSMPFWSVPQDVRWVVPLSTLCVLCLLFTQFTSFATLLALKFTGSGWYDAVRNVWRLSQESSWRLPLGPLTLSDYRFCFKSRNPLWAERKCDKQGFRFQSFARSIGANRALDLVISHSPLGMCFFTLEDTCSLYFPGKIFVPELESVEDSICVLKDGLPSTQSQFDSEINKVITNWNARHEVCITWFSPL